MGRIKPTLLLVALVSVALAGCAEDAGPLGGEETPEPGKVNATSTTGGIRGVVVDSSIVPVAGALVRVLNTELSMEADENGLFVFSGLEEGTYFVEASHPLYDVQQTSADVVAGVEEPAAVKIQLTRLISTEPYLVTEFYEGYITCSANIVIALSEECGEGVGVEGFGRVGQNPNNRAQIDFNVQSNLVRSLVVESVWEPSLTVGAGGAQQGGFNMGIYIDWSCLPVCSAAGGTVDRKNSVSPMYLRNDEKLAELEVDETTAFSTFTWAASDETGVLLEQPFEVFVSASYAIALPEDWSFVANSPNPFA